MMANGWHPVPSRHSQVFEISGNNIPHGGCVLMERPAQVTTDARQREIDAAHEMVSGWKNQWRKDGLVAFNQDWPDGFNVDEKRKMVLTSPRGKLT